jgi:hypothetical protein
MTPTIIINAALSLITCLALLGILTRVTGWLAAEAEHGGDGGDWRRRGHLSPSGPSDPRGMHVTGAHTWQRPDGTTAPLARGRPLTDLQPNRLIEAARRPGRHPSGRGRARERSAAVPDMGSARTSKRRMAS